MSTKEELYKLLRDKGSFEVVKETDGPQQLRIIGRVAKDRFNFWLMVVHKLLTAANQPGCYWSCDISKQYMLAPDGVRFGWRLIFQGANLDESFAEICKLVSQAPRPAVVELDSQLLPGFQDGQDRGGQSVNGKGAASMFGAVTGPRAAQQRRAGGH